MAFATIDKGASYFNPVLYTGNGASPRSITGVGFKPDFVWSKQRSAAENHNLYDAVRGGANSLRSNLTNAENASSIYGYVSTFDSDGVTYISGGTNNDLNNGNGITFVNWNWLAANSTTTNTSGTITSTVSANTTSGFSIATYTGNGTSGATVGHGLGVAPSMIIIKSRSNGGAQWAVYHQSLGNTQALQLDASNAASASAAYWNNTSPTSTVFSLGNGTDPNQNTGTYVAYCFTAIKGYSKFGSYVGNGSTNGTFVYTGFKPAFIMIKSSSSAAGNWLIQDNKRLGYNPSNAELYANLTNTESTADRTDLLSNGFKARINSGENNSSGVTYIYAAFAENPFVLTDGTPVTAR